MSSPAGPKNKPGRNAADSHRQESVQLLIFNFLLILTLLTIWLFKHRRVRFLHETGGAMFYGLIMGLILRYTIPSPDPESSIVHRCEDVTSNPGILLLNVTDRLYEYEYKREIAKHNVNNRQGNEILRK
ncbi:sodium/hydrogen exchanger 9-like, partial [Rhincodon typus]|uniref:sodium/hydrogen exchanger 9-like n=1 Tax=Rhincodon typus TaxID=259920 RepID=UPI00202FCC4A